ncbi:hypothetical protein ACOMHN_017361 [Nucella lapillus]
MPLVQRYTSSEDNKAVWRQPCGPEWLADVRGRQRDGSSPHGLDQYFKLYAGTTAQRSDVSQDLHTITVWLPARSEHTPTETELL